MDKRQAKTCCLNLAKIFFPPRNMANCLFVRFFLMSPWEPPYPHHLANMPWEPGPTLVPWKKLG